MSPVLIALSALALGGTLFFLYRYCKRRNGIDGGLSLVVLGLLVLGPLGGFVAIGWLQSIANSHPALAENPYWDLYYTFAILVTSFSIAASIFGGAGLVTSKQRSAVIRAQTSIWLAGPVANGLFLFVAGKVAALVAVKGPDFFPGILLPLALAIAASASHILACRDGNEKPSASMVRTRGLR